MCEVFFEDGKAIECPNVTLDEMFVLYCVVCKSGARITCSFKIGKSLLRLDIAHLDSQKTFRGKYDLREVTKAA